MAGSSNGDQRLRDAATELRELQRMQEQIVASLPASIIYNPLMTILAALPFIFGAATFGYVSWWAIARVKLPTPARVAAHYERMRARPSVEKAMADEGLRDAA